VSPTDDAVLSAPLPVEFDYTRSLGPVLRDFFTGLRDGRIVGVKAADGRVIVPPVEADPVTSENLTETVEVGQDGEVVSWSWQPSPVRGNPLDRPFAWALVLLDGAATPMLHALDAGSPDAVTTGMRVKARWRAERTGSIQDIECFEPAGDSA
jgi:hypothetical protein